MSLDNLTKSKREAWDTGVEAFHDFVQKVFESAMVACIDNCQSDAQPPTWDEVERRLAKLADQIAKGRDYVFTLNPFVPRDLPPAIEKGYYKSFGAPPKKKEDATEID